MTSGRPPSLGLAGAFASGAELGRGSPAEAALPASSLPSPEADMLASEPAEAPRTSGSLPAAASEVKLGVARLVPPPCGTARVVLALVCAAGVGNTAAPVAGSGAGRGCCEESAAFSVGAKEPQGGAFASEVEVVVPLPV